MRIDKAFAVAARECATLVPGHQRTFNGRWHGAGFATDIQRLAFLVFTDDNRMTITTQSFDAFTIL